jgi:type II restriction enzyme
MDLAFQAALVAGYTSPSQKIKVLSEHWIGRESYCPSCGHVNMTRYGNNRPVADFFCSACRADFELKSQGRNFGATVADGRLPRHDRATHQQYQSKSAASSL